MIPVTPELDRGRDGQISEAHWPENLAKSMSFRFIHRETLFQKSKCGK